MRSRYFNLPLMIVAAMLAFAVGCDTTDPDPTPPGATVEFASSGTGAVPADSTVNVPIEISNPQGQEVSVEVLFAQGASSAAQADVAGFETETVTFSANAEHGDVEYATIDISDANISAGSITAEFALQRATPEGTQIGSNREFTLNLGPTDIMEARANAREAGSGNHTVTVQGIVIAAMGGETRIQDETGGIMIRDARSDGDFAGDVSSGEVSRGDEIIVTGRVSWFSGLAQIDGNNISEYSVTSRGNELPAPEVATLDDIASDGEYYESRLVRIENLTLDNPPSTFSSGSNNDVSDGSNGVGVDLRIPNSGETYWDGEPAPQGTFTFEGPLTQFNAGFGGAIEPDEGYQLLPVHEDHLIFEDENGDNGDSDDPHFVTIAEARAAANGDVGTVEALVTRSFGSETRIQENVDGNIAAINVFSGDFADMVAPGDSIRITGERGEFNGLAQLSDLEEMEVLNSGNSMPDPVMVTIEELHDAELDAFESQVIGLENLEIDVEGEFEGDTTYSASDGTGEIDIRVHRDSELVGMDIPEEAFMYEGVLGRFRDNLQLFPILSDDLILD